MLVGGALSQSTSQLFVTNNLILEAILLLPQGMSLPLRSSRVVYCFLNGGSVPGKMLADAVFVGLKEPNTLSSPSPVNLQFFKLNTLIFLEAPMITDSRLIQLVKSKYSRLGKFAPTKDFKLVFPSRLILLR